MAKLVQHPDLFLPGNVSGSPTVRDDVDLMCHPFFSLEKDRTEPMEYEGTIGPIKTKVRITGADYGIATQWDNDVMLYLRTAVVAALNRGEAPQRRIRFPAHDFLQATKRGTSGREYENLKKALQRLKATTITTNAGAEGWTVDKGVSWIDSYEFVTRDTARGKMMVAVEVVVSEWAFAMMTDVKRALSVDPAYFDLTSSLERKVYGIIRKHCGLQPSWSVSIEKLRDICGSTREVWRFKHDLKKLVDRQALPGYTVSMSSQPVIGQSASTGAEGAKLADLKYFVVRREASKLSLV